MRNYSHIISKLYEPAVITPGRHAALCQLLEMKLAGAELGAESRVQSPKSNAQDDPIEGVEMEPVEENTQTVGGTVIIPVHGTLVAHPEDIAMSECGCAMEELNAAIDAAEADSNVERMIFDFRTPGGTVTGIPETARKILYSRKETIAYTDSECCSGGIWLASQCQKFYATQSSRVGSVGVYCMMLDMSEAMKKEGIKVNAISAGKYKLLGASWKPMTDEERKIVQAGVDKIYSQFKEAMEAYRIVNDKNFGNGLVFDGEEAAEIGFTDGVVESMEDILEEMVE